MAKSDQALGLALMQLVLYVPGREQSFVILFWTLPIFQENIEEGLLWIFVFKGQLYII